MPRLAGDHRQAVLLGDGRGPAGGFGGVGGAVLARAAGKQDEVALATAGLAARLDFTLDEIEDLRIAVDEACAILL
ncbi:hypothetical protein ACWEP3_27550, partial [Streptomyces albidoflavus]